MTVRQLFLTVSMAAVIPAAFGQTAPATSTRTLRFQAIGLGSTETAQVNLHNTASNPTTGTAASCTGTVTFLNGSGTTIGGATTFTVTAEQVASVRLPFGGTGNRTMIVPEVSATFTAGTPCALSVSLETFDTSSGATHVEIGGGSLAGGLGR